MAIQGLSTGVHISPEGLVTGAPAGTTYTTGGGLSTTTQPSQDTPSRIQTGSHPQGATQTYTPAQAPQTGTLNANISTPSTANVKVPAPVVVTSDAATKDFANKQNQVNQLQQDTAQHQIAVNTPVQAPQDTQQNQQTDTQQPASLDDQISQIFGNLGTQSSQIDQNAQDQITPLQVQQQQVQTELDNQAASALSKLNMIASGTYPLSGAEQSLLSSTRDTFAATIAAQQTANQAYAGQMTELAASLGISTTAPTQAIGLIQAAISSGNEKVATLNAQMATSLANLQLGFQSQDYNQVSDAWDKTSKYLSDRVATLQDMQKQVTSAAAQQKSDLMDQTKLVLSTMMQSAQFNADQKQNAIDNAFKSQQISETKRHDLAQEAISYAAANPAPLTGGSVTGGVSVGASGAPNSAQQQQFLSQLPGGATGSIATQIKGLADYSINPASFPTRITKGMSGLTQQQAVTLAKQYDPSYDQNQYSTRAATMKQFQSGTYSQNVTALNTAIGHINDLVSNTQKLGNVGFTPANVVKNSVESLLGAGNVVGAKTNIQAAVGELATAFKKSGATDSEIKNLGTIDANSSPAQIKAFISTASSLLGSRLSALDSTYQSSMGTAPTGGTFLSPSAQNVLLNLQGQGYDVQVENLGGTPVAQLRAFNSAGPQNAAILTQLQQAMPNATPAEVVDFLETNGLQIPQYQVPAQTTNRSSSVLDGASTVLRGANLLSQVSPGLI